MIRFDLEKADFAKFARDTAIPRRVMFDVVTAVRHEIQDRLDMGLDVNRRKFRPYSESYKNDKEVWRTGKDPNTVNMRLSGKMRNSIMPVHVRDNNAELEIKDHTAPAYYNQKDRNWWGMCSNCLRIITQRIDNYLQRITR